MSDSPRWLLQEPHYLNIPALPDGTHIEWEHNESSRTTGKAVRKLYKVPLLLDPKDPNDCNHPGEIIVALRVEGARWDRKDIEFIGDPTPGMEPLNEEAQVITDSMRHKWEHPIETLPANGGMTGEESAFMAKMMEAFAKGSAQTAVVPQSQYDELKERLAKLEALLAAGQAVKPPPAVERRV